MGYVEVEGVIMEGMYFYYKKTKKCLLNKCDGKLFLFKIRTRQGNKERIIDAKKCQKCGQLYLSFSMYDSFISTECAKEYPVKNSFEDIQSMLEEREQKNQKMEQRRKEILEEIKKERLAKEKKDKVEMMIDNSPQNYLSLIISRTETNEIKWKKRMSTKNSIIMREVYIAKSSEGELRFEIFGKSDDGKKFRTHSELTVDGINRKLRDNKNKLYNAIIKNVERQNQTSSTKKLVNKQIKTVHIKYKDFVVRTNIVKCISEQHLLEDIIGIISIVTPNGTIIEQEIPAAYCLECKCYFILKDEFKKKKKKGILLCNLIEREEFYKYGLKHSIYLSKESILMRNGYNVKANVGLTDMQRQTILANLIDEKIISAFEITNYLRWFISQKEYLPAYRMAVNKWKADMQFVRSYREDNRRRIFVSSVTRTTYKKI